MHKTIRLIIKFCHAYGIVEKVMLICAEKLFVDFMQGTSDVDRDLVSGHVQTKERIRREKIAERLRGRDQERVSPTPTTSECK